MSNHINHHRDYLRQLRREFVFFINNPEQRPKQTRQVIEKAKPKKARKQWEQLGLL